jgi:hypothetical protein
MRDVPAPHRRQRCSLSPSPAPPPLTPSRQDKVLVYTYSPPSFPLFPTSVSVEAAASLCSRPTDCPRALRTGLIWRSGWERGEGGDERHGVAVLCWFAWSHPPRPTAGDDHLRLEPPVQPSSSSVVKVNPPFFSMFPISCKDIVMYLMCMCEILDRSRVSSFRLSLYRPSFRIRCMERFLGGLSNVLDVPFKPQSNK